METPKFTIFARWAPGTPHDGADCWFPPYGSEASLQERIEHVCHYHGRGTFIPVAWALNESDEDGLHRPLRAESIAAGRTIELIDGRYVPRGVPVEAPNHCDHLKGSCTQCHQCLLLQGATTCPACDPAPEPKPAERRFPGDQDFAGTTESERTRPALTWADSKRVDRWEGYAVTSSKALTGEVHDGFLTVTIASERPVPLHPLQRIAQEGDQLHGSAFLRKGA
jgi:hypothetical protein